MLTNRSLLMTRTLRPVTSAGVLIGSFENNAVDGAYLPRNYDNDLPGQNADLPLYRDKRVIDGNRAIKRDYPARYGLKNGHSR